MLEVTTAEVKRYLKVLLRWWWFIIFATGLAGGSMYFYTDRQPRFYASRTTLMVGNDIYSANPDQSKLQLSRTLAQIYGELIMQRPILEGVIEKLGLDLVPDQLRGMVSSNMVWDAALLQINVVDVHPERAQILATAIGEELIAQSPTNGSGLGDREFIQGQLKRLQQQIEEATAQIDQLETSLETLTSAADITEVKSRIDSWNQIKVGYQNNYAQLLNSVSQDVINSLTVVEPASYSDYPISPNVRLNTLAGVIAGALLAVVGIIVVEFFNDGLEWQGIDSQIVGNLPVLGAIAKYQTDDERDLIFARQTDWSPEIDSVRSLRTNIFLMKGDGLARSLLITSPSPGDGKSTTAANLATVIATGGSKVILIDGDLRRPRVNELFDLPNVSGLGDLLHFGSEENLEMELTDLLLETDVENLLLLPAGKPPVDPAALLSKRTLKLVLEQALRLADYVIIDAAPVMVGPDTSLLGKLAHATVVVVSVGQTTRSLLTRAVERLHRFGQVNLVGLIFNKVDLRKTDTYKTSYYSYSQQVFRPEAQTQRRLAPKGLLSVWFGPPRDGGNYMTVSEAASLLGLSERALQRWCETGRISAQKRGFRWWLRRTDVEQYGSWGSKELIESLLEETSPSGS
jgi:non-specific protein-tyrosine kinase